MEQSYYRIGEVSRATGLSKDTLHFYDKISLLSPDHVDPQNGYRYYSLRNLWQLDIITTCRKLNIPLDTVRQILSLQDNAEIVRLLMEYREEALRRSAYYQQVAEDILWYKEEHRRIEAQKDDPPLVRQVWREAEQVIAGRAAQRAQGYHVNLQQAAQEPLRQASSIRRRYGYLLDGAGTGLGILIARMDGCGDITAQRDTIKSSLWLGVFNFALFACVSLAVLEGYFALSSDQPMVRQQGIQYAQVVLAGSLGLFVESHCTKLLQARGNTLVPMLAQVTGAAINMVLDPILIFGRLGAPALRIICLSFLPAGIAMTLTVFFQGSGQSRQSIFIIVLRQVVLLVPLAWVFHFAGLTYVWLTFPVTEVLSVLCALAFYRGAPFLSKRRNAE